jgi:hypothetical protein
VTAAANLTIHARFLVVREMPLAVIDLEGDEPAMPLVDDNLLKRLVEAGLVMLPGFYGVDFPKGARMGWTLTREECRLEDERESRFLRVDRDRVDPLWADAALRLKGTMLLAGWHLGVGPDQPAKELCDVLDVAARSGRVAGAIVGVAEPREGLPLVF